MIEFGNANLFLSLAGAIYATMEALRGLKNQDERQISRSRKATWASCFFVVGASFTLLVAFLTDNFRFSYVARHSERRLDVLYKISAFWAGQAGSLLLWLLFLSLVAVFLLWRKKYRAGDLDSKAVLFVNALRIFFLSLLLFVTSPFAQEAVVARDGQGLNPMLQSLGMVVHPPLLFLSFSGLIAPFSFTAVDFLERNKDGRWLRLARPWLLFSWTFLTMGIVTGGQWAYNELGWGGYWAWDPVENASLFPWLTATALLHCLQLPRSRRSTKIGAFSLIMLTFILTIFSTFLTRSGVLDSVHAFASGLVGYLFLIALGLLLGFALYLAFSRSSLFAGEGATAGWHWFSKEAGIAAAIFLLLLLLAAVFFGTMFPLFSRWFLAREIVLGEEYFNQIAAPLFLALFSIMAVAPLCGWQKTKWAGLGKKAVLPLGAGLLVFIYCRWQLQVGVWGSFSFAVAALGISSHLQALWRRTPKKAGAYIAHLGIFVMLIGITGSLVFKEELYVTANPGDSAWINGYQLIYPGLKVEWGISKYTVGATLQVLKDEKPIGEVTSRKTFYESRQQPATKVGILSTFQQDLYFDLAGWQGQSAQLHLQAFGLVLWIWLGSALLYLGAALVMLPQKQWFGSKLKEVRRGLSIGSKRSL